MSKQKIAVVGATGRAGRHVVEALEAAVSTYRREFRPSAQLAEPYVIAGVNVVAADTEDDARQALQAVRRNLAVGLFGRGRSFTDEEADLEIAWLDLDEAVAMVFRGEITNAAAVGGLLAAARARDGGWAALRPV